MYNSRREECGNKLYLGKVLNITPSKVLNIAADVTSKGKKNVPNLPCACQSVDLLECQSFCVT